MMKPVATKPINVSTNNFPFQRDKSRSSMEMEPSPCGLSPATRLYIGRAPNKVSNTKKNVATGANAPAANTAIPG
jgi:hypothetical protein